MLVVGECYLCGKVSKLNLMGTVKHYHTYTVVDDKEGKYSNVEYVCKKCFDLLNKGKTVPAIVMI